MGDFIPGDWMRIGSAIVAAWWGCRFVYLVFTTALGGEEHKIVVTMHVHMKDGDDR